MTYRAGLIAALLTCLVAWPAQAQDGPAAAPGAEATAGATAEAILETAREVLRPPGVRVPCPPPTNPNEIVVCGNLDESGNRVDSSSDEAYAAGQAVSDGLPRAPDAFGIPSGGVTIPIGSPPEPVYYIDLKAIPEAPPGSDAARYAEDAEGEPASAE